MTPEDLALVISAVIVPGQKAEVTREDILRHFGTTDGRKLGLRLLREAADEKATADLEAALIVCNLFGFGMEHLPLLIDLAPANWHQQHENIAFMLSQLKHPSAIAVLHHMATWVPDYLDWDENRALAVKAIWGLGKTPGTEAEQALLSLLEDEDEIVREEAEAQLQRRNKR